MDLSALAVPAVGAGAGAYPDSLDSSPRSRTDFDSDASPKIRLMCSFGGRIVPRPTDKSLCYLGGDTRMVSIDRHASLSDLLPRLSRSLLSSRPFLLKYQLPNEDLDSLISISTDEDLENLIDEYDRLSNSGTVKPSRIRLFLFPIKSESAPSSINTISSLLDDSKSETWFVDALNGALIDRGMSADVNSLLGLEDMRVEAKVLVPESPMLDTTSSFGSASSGAYLTNLPPIKVREERVEEAGGVTAGQEMLNEMGFAQREVARNVNVSPTGDGAREGVSDEEQGGARKQPSPPQQQQIQQAQQQVQQTQQQPKAEAPIGDPVARPIYYQDKPSTATIPAVAAQAPAPAPAPTPATVTTAAATDPSYRGYLMPEQIQYQQQQQQLQQQQHQQLQQQQQQQQQQQHQPQQYTHYIHPATGAVLPVPSYYQMPQAIPQPHHYDPQMQMYYMPVRPNAPYNLAPIQPNIGDSPVAAAATAAIAIPNSAAMPVVPVPKIPARAELPVNPAGLYRAPTQAPQLIHVTPDQAQAYANMGYQIVHQNRPQYPSQTATAMGNYGYEYAADPSHTQHTQQVYYAPATSPHALAPQYQSMASPAVSVIPDVTLAPQPQLQTQARS